MFCQWFLQQCGTNPNFSASVISTDEAQFTRDGMQIFTISICGQMRFFHHITNCGSPSTCGSVFVVIIYLDLTYFQTGLHGGITKLSWKTTFLISWPKYH
jgi:hypothetical protein